VNYSVLVLCVALSGCSSLSPKERVKERVKETVKELACPKSEVVIPLRIVIDVAKE